MFGVSSLCEPLVARQLPPPISFRNQTFHPLPSSPHVDAINASSNRRRRRSSKQEKKVRQCISFVASNLRVLPRAFDLLFDGAGGSGGGSEFWKGFGWGGGSDWNRRKKVGFEAILISVSVSVLLVLRKPEERELGIRVWVWVTSLLGAMKKGWVPAFCCFGLLMALLWNTKQGDVERFFHKFAGLTRSAAGFRRRRRTLI